MTSIVPPPGNIPGRTLPLVAAIRLHVTRRLLQLAVPVNAAPSKPQSCTRHETMVDRQSPLPGELQQLAALLACDQYTQAERLLQNSIRSLSAAVPPRPPCLPEWLLLALFALLHDDATSASGYLHQAQRHRERERSLVQGHPTQLDFVLQLACCMVLTSLQRPADAEELLQASESGESTVHDPTRMWLVLQLRTAISLVRSHYRAAWGTWQAAMAIQRTRERRSKVAVIPGGDWLKSMAFQEAAAGMN